MTVQDYLRTLRERWLIIAVVTVLGLAGALSVYLLRPPEYTSSISLYVSAQVGSDPQQAYQGAQLSEQRVKSYTELATGDRVMGETVRRLSLDVSPSDLASTVSATSAADSVIIEVSVRNRSAEQAAAIANTVGVVVGATVDDLERPTSPLGIAPVAVRVVQPAQAPLVPSSPGLPLMLGLGLVAGLAIGVGAAFLRNALDISIRSPGHLGSASGAPVLGSISFEPKAKGQPLTTSADSRSSTSEEFRQLRTNLKYADIDRPRQVIAITSSVPEEGKTTTLANLAIALASTGSRTLVIDADMRRPRLATLLGLDSKVGLTTVLSGGIDLHRAVQSWRGGSFDVLAAGPTPPNPSELLASNQMRILLSEARRNYDHILIDTPPLLPVSDPAAVAPAVDGVLLVCRYRSTNRAQVESAAAALRSVAVEPLGAIMTMGPPGPMSSTEYRNYHLMLDNANQAEGGASRNTASTPSTLRQQRQSQHGVRPTHGLTESPTVSVRPDDQANRKS